MKIRIGHFEFDDVAYDSEADVLYLSIGEPREAAHTDPTSEGHAIRYDDQDRVVGITIVNAKWLVERDGEVTLTERVSGEELAPALAL